MIRKPQSRRGVVILVVLSLLVLFVLLVVTYAIVTGQYRRAAQAYARQELLRLDPQKDLERGFYEFLRDTTDRSSAVRFHSLLRDYYGGDGFRGVLKTGTELNTVNTTGPTQPPSSSWLSATNAYNWSGKQLMDLVVTIDSAAGTVIVSTDGVDLTAANRTAVGYYGGLRDLVGYYKGCLLTFTSGKAQGVSTRIVGYDFIWDAARSIRLPYFRVMCPRTDSGQVLAPSDVGGASFVVNGRPFSGTGLGLDKQTNDLTALDSTTSQPASLVPNYAPLSVIPRVVNRGSISGNAPFAAYQAYGPPLGTHVPTDIAQVLTGDADEGYDAADYQNMFLAVMTPDASSVIPSLHRPDLISYWQTNYSNYATDPAFQQRVSLRPVRVLPGVLGSMPQGFNPNFDGSNPDYDPIKAMSYVDADGNGRRDYAWDVDNDGDGIADSVWVDFGFPVQTAPDGRRYKPLFAVLCTDLDGRLNVNAHDRKRFFTPAQYVSVVGGTTNTVTTPRGLNYGPPEISLSAAGITGNLTGLLDTRYGDGYPGVMGYDMRARLKFFEEPENYFFPTLGGRSSYSTPADLRAELAFGVNDYGQPSFEELTNTVTEARADSPYELNLVDPAGADTHPFLPVELERILRRFDHDVSTLPSRLSDFITNWNQLSSPNARLITTASFDPPVPAHGIPERLADEAASLSPVVDLSTVNTFADLLTIRLRKGNVLPQNLATELGNMLWPDVAMGVRLDINRALGNGRDNNNNAVVDEAGEQNNEQIYADVGTTHTEFQSTPMWHVNGADLNNDGTRDWKDAALARQLLARHLYVLTLTLCDIDSLNVDPGLAREIAQWAINVVDFRDADSIMTPFEFDPNPFDGWSVDGIVNGYMTLTSSDDNINNIVWGCERPELLLSESLAFHARRTSDTKLDPPDYTNTTDAPTPDDDYDQQYVPFGAAFVELYNPWAGTDTAKTPPGELYTQVNSATTSTNYYGVDLTKVAPGNSPVWRMVIVNKNDQAVAPGAPDPDNPGAPLTIDRTVYFVPSNQVGNVPGSGLRYYRNQNVPCCPIPPGRYAVVGGGYQAGGRWVSPVGHVDPANPNTQPNADVKRIALGPALDPDLNQVEIYPGNGVAPTTPTNPAIAIAVTDSNLDLAACVPQAFNVSEPTVGYPLSDPAGQTYNSATRMYEDSAGQPLPFDQPLDESRNTSAGFIQDVALTNGTVASFCRVYLQRLADPTQTFDALANPYRTLDSITIDLTAFNGTVPYASDDPRVTDIGVNFSCLQRGDSDQALTPRRLWPQEPARMAAGAQAPDPNDVHFFPYGLTQTLGDVNTRYRNITTATFPWLVWNNRPYTSAYELLMVPRLRSWDLLRVDTTDANLRAGYFLPSEMPAGASPYDDTGVQGQYPHLVNFFYATSTALNAHRLFDYVHVPSRFVGTEEVLNPNYFGKTTTYAQPNLVSFGLLPPFNRISQYRDPGRVNINTITSQTVWDAVRGGRGPSYAQLLQSRQRLGWTIPTAGMSLPSLIDNPFRPSGSNSHVPVAGLKQSQDIEVTLLRRHPAQTSVPLMESAGMGNLATDPRNSFFRYELFNRLGNMATTRSNVYAIWITVGYFEMEPNLDNTGAVAYDEFHPDGLRLAQELGLDTAQVRRHRAFFMVDRTIPVGFVPGENHNVDKCVLLRRFIE